MHGGHFFDEKNPEDINKLNDWKSRDIDIIVWTVKDLIKRDFAIRNKLNYVVLWSEKELNNFIDGKFELVDTSISVPDLIIDSNDKNQCQICGIIHHNISGHVRNFHKMSSKNYYDKYLKQPDEGICPTCGKPTEFKGLTKGGYRKHCSTKCSTLDPKVQEKLKATNLEKYGVENPYQSEEIKERIKQDQLAKFGVDHPLKRKEIVKKVGIKSAQTKYKIKDDFIAEHPELITKEQLTEKYGWMWYWNNVIEPVKMLQGGRYTNYYHISDIPKIETYIEETIHKNRSHKEMELLRFVQSIYGGTIKHDCKSVISPKEIDIYLPDLQLGIEYNGTRWHSIEMGTPKGYHLDKSLLCRNKGIRLIHIYEFEDFEEQKQLIKDLISGVDNYLADDFNKNNLIQSIPVPEIIYKDKVHTIYGVGKLVQNG